MLVRMSNIPATEVQLHQDLAQDMVLSAHN